MAGMEITVFRDVCYNYIRVDKEIVRNIIDNAVFQRLRRIEQSNLNILYPSATHNRFQHSIGTYYLANLLIKKIKEKNDFTSDREIEKYLDSFEIAALLHDVGHAPFSHTTEDLFRRREDVNKLDIKKDIINEFSKYAKINSEFEEQLISHRDASQHEFGSCYVLLKAYNKFLSDRKYDIEYIIRCILGMKYNCADNDFKKSFANHLISFLNGQNIDVDKLDYLIRDTHYSGYSGAKIDYERIFDSIVFSRNNDSDVCEFGYSSKVFSAFENVKLVSVAEQLHFFNHHTLIYRNYLIISAIHNLCKNLSIEICDIFNYENIFNNDENQYKLLSDDDIWMFFKNNSCKIKSQYNQLTDRSQAYKPIWKDLYQFKHYIYDKQDFKYSQCISDINGFIKVFTNGYGKNIAYNTILTDENTKASVS